MVEPSVKTEIDEKVEQLSRNKGAWQAVPVDAKAKLLRGALGATSGCERRPWLSRYARCGSVRVSGRPRTVCSIDNRFQEPLIRRPSQVGRERTI